MELLLLLLLLRFIFILHFLKNLPIGDFFLDDELAESEAKFFFDDGNGIFIWIGFKILIPLASSRSRISTSFNVKLSNGFPGGAILLYLKKKIVIK